MKFGCFQRIHYGIHYSDRLPFSVFVMSHWHAKKMPSCRRRIDILFFCYRWVSDISSATVCSFFQKIGSCFIIFYEPICSSIDFVRNMFAVTVRKNFKFNDAQKFLAEKFNCFNLAKILYLPNFFNSPKENVCKQTLRLCLAKSWATVSMVSRWKRVFIGLK